MDGASSDVEIVSSTRRAPSRPQPNPTRSTDYSHYRASASADPGPSRRDRTISTQPSNVITLSDESDEDARVAPQPRPTRYPSRADDEDVMILAESYTTARRAPSRSSSPEALQPLESLWNTERAAPSLGRSASMATASTSKNHAQKSLPVRARTLAAIPDFDFASSPPRRASSPILFETGSTAVRKGKGKQLPDEVSDDVGSYRRKARQMTEDDAWNAILGGDSDAGGAKKKKGKAKAKEADGTRKRLISDDESGPEGDPAGPSRGKRKSPGKKAPRVSAEDSLSTRDQAAAGKISKTALKKQETADRQKLAKANTLKTTDKKATAAELTIHFSGKAFDALDGGSDTEEEGTGGGGARGAKGRGRRKKEKPSPWLEVTEAVSLAQWSCAIERPEYPRRDLGCEGAVRWTRLCDKRWDDALEYYVPLPDHQRIVVEEDTRLIFLNAHDLSRHIARRTLSKFVKDVQAKLAPHVRLFVLIHGLQSIFRDLERVRQAEYKRDLQKTAEERQSIAIKPAGIGPDQPSKDELEFGIMRMQMETKCMIINVEKVEDGVEWLEQLTITVGQKPHQRYKQSHAELLGTDGASQPSGKGSQDTYLKMLSSVKGVTPALAEGIASCYPTMRSLLDAWDRCAGGEPGRKEMLRGIERGRKVDGSATHRVIGSTLSANIYRMLTSENPNMFI